MEFKFAAIDLDGKNFEVTLNDQFIDYYYFLRHKLPESTCIYAIEKIKKESGKKIVMLYGNCQMGALQQMLSSHFQFQKEYFFLRIPAVCQYNDDLVRSIFGGGGQFLQLVDLFISQRVKETNKFGKILATKNISSKLNENCKIVWIPNTYFDGYFPQRINNSHYVREFPYRFFHGDKYVNEIMEKSDMNPDIDAILDKICDPNFIPAREIQNVTEDSLTELKSREWFCDVKISDYIETNLFGKQIFYAGNHPSLQVMMEVAKRILRMIGMHSDNFLNIHALLDDSNLKIALIGQDVPVYASVIKFFDLREKLDIYYANRFVWDFKGNFREYMREYIKQCWAEKFTE